MWRARDEVLQRPVAVKLRASTEDGPSFVREARTAARASHANLVQIFDYGAEAGHRFLVMEFVDGGTLADRLESGPMSSAEVRALACGLLAALGCVHRAGLVHGSITRDSVLCGSDGRARLTGFGLAGPQAGGEGASEPPSRRGDLHALGLLLRGIPLLDEADPAFLYTVARLSRSRPEQRPLDAEDALRSLRCREEEVGQATEEFDALAFALEAERPVPASARRRWWPAFSLG